MLAVSTRGRGELRLWFGGTAVISSASVPIARKGAPGHLATVQARHCAWTCHTASERKFFAKLLFTKATSSNCPTQWFNSLYLEHLADTIQLYSRRQAIGNTSTNTMTAIDIINKCPVMIAFNTAGHIVPLWCGQWDCSYCRLRLSSEWAAIARNAIVVFKPAQSYMWSLTMGSDVDTRAKGFARIKSGWDTFRRGIQDGIMPDKWQYLAVVEGQPRRDFMPHFHIITPILFPLPTKRRKLEDMLKDYAVACGFGFQAHQRAITGEDGAKYVAKYLSKAGAGFPKSFRRMRKSQKWPMPAKAKALVNPLILWERGEKLQDYLIRVSELTDISLQKATDVYLSARQTYRKIRTTRDNTQPTSD